MWPFSMAWAAETGLPFFCGHVLVEPDVPDDDGARAAPPAAAALELEVVQVVVADPVGQPLVRGVERRALRHRPGDQHAVDLEPEVEVQVGGVVALHHEPWLLRLLGSCHQVNNLGRGREGLDRDPGPESVQAHCLDEAFGLGALQQKGLDLALEQRFLQGKVDGDLVGFADSGPAELEDAEVVVECRIDVPLGLRGDRVQEGGGSSLSARGRRPPSG